MSEMVWGSITEDEIMNKLIGWQTDDDVYRRPAKSVSTTRYRLESVAFVASDVVTCWKCGSKVREYGVGFHFIPEDSQREEIWRVMSFAEVNDIAVFTDAFLEYIKENYSIKTRYSKTAQEEYLSLGCGQCDALFGDMFVYRNFKGSGLGISGQGAENNSPLLWFDLPRMADNQYRTFSEVFNTTFYIDVDPRRIRREGEHPVGKVMPVWGAIPRSMA